MALVILVLMVRGFFVSPYTFSGEDEFKEAIWLTVGGAGRFSGELESLRETEAGMRESRPGGRPTSGILEAEEQAMASLPDELLLMAWVKGERLSLPTLCITAFPAQILSELFQQRRLTLTTDGLVAASGSAKSAGDAVLDDALSRIRSAPSLRAVRHWLGQEFRRRGKTREALLERCCVRASLSRRKRVC